jgi:hypothetical protein
MCCLAISSSFLVVCLAAIWWGLWEEQFVIIVGCPALANVMAQMAKFPLADQVLRSS